jgi:hypothetical protein
LILSFLITIAPITSKPSIELRIDSYTNPCQIPAMISSWVHSMFFKIVSNKARIGNPLFF